MPLFEYACRDCGRAFETFVTADRRPACPGCGGASLEKLLSSPGMVGSGDAARRSEAGPPAGGCGMGGDACACRAGLAN